MVGGIHQEGLYLRRTHEPHAAIQCRLGCAGLHWPLHSGGSVQRGYLPLQDGQESRLRLLDGTAIYQVHGVIHKDSRVTLSDS